MDAAELKAWRESRGYSQENLASLLGMTRQQIANYELERSAIPGDLPILLATVPALTKPKRSNNRALLPHGARYLSLSFQPLSQAEVEALPMHALYWRQSQHSTSYNLFQISPHVKPRDPNNMIIGLCTFILMDTPAYRARHVAGLPDPLVDKLNAFMDENRAALEAIPLSTPLKN